MRIRDGTPTRRLKVSAKNEICKKRPAFTVSKWLRVQGRSVNEKESVPPAGPKAKCRFQSRDCSGRHWHCQRRSTPNYNRQCTAKQHTVILNCTARQARRGGFRSASAKLLLYFSSTSAKSHPSRANHHVSQLPQPLCILYERINTALLIWDQLQVLEITPHIMQSTQSLEGRIFNRLNV